MLATLFCLLPGVPDIYIRPAAQTLRPGDYLTMRCIEADNEPVLFEWSNVNGTLSSAAYTDSYSGLLEVSSATADDAGQYKCRATNQAGSSDAFAEVILAGMLPFHVGICRYAQRIANILLHASILFLCKIC